MVYQGCDDSFRREIPEEELEGVRRRPACPKVCASGHTIEERKNPELTVRGMASLPKDVCLLAVGRDRKGYMDKVKKIAAEAGVADRLIFRHDISFADLPGCEPPWRRLWPTRRDMKGSESLFWKLLRADVPLWPPQALASKRPGRGRCLCKPRRCKRDGRYLNAILTGSADVARMTGEGKRHASCFDTSGMASRIMAVYERAIANR